MYTFRSSMTPAGKTLVAASTTQAEVRGELKNGGNIAAAGRWQDDCHRGRLRPALSRRVRSRWPRYHGRIKALADAAREGGLKLQKTLGTPATGGRY